MLRALVAMLGVAMLGMATPSMATAQTVELRERLADTQDERKRTEAELGDLVTAESKAGHRLAVIDDELDAAQRQLAELEAELEVAKSALAGALERAGDARARLAAVKAEVARAESELEIKHDRLEQRLRAAFKYGQVSFVEAFTGVRDIADFLNSTTYIGHVLDGDRELVEEVASLLHEVEQQRTEAQELRVAAEREAAASRDATAEVEQATADQERLAVLVRERRADQQAALTALREDRAAVEGHLIGLEAESARIEDQLTEIARQQAAAAERAAAEERAQAAASEASSGVSGTASPTNGGWTRPTAGGSTSSFGPRWGRAHQGVDLGGAVGSTVVAARAGTVVQVTSSCHPTSSWGCGGGFGNYVTVAHADGMATIYAHLSSLAVGTGQQVSAGTPIGSIGNSGNSYGPHLHFETRRSGSPRNPCAYIRC